MSSIKLRTPKWAKLDENVKRDESTDDVDSFAADEEESEALSALNEMTRSTGRYTTDARKTSVLGAEQSTAQRLRDVTIGNNRGGRLRSIKFHPSHPILVTGAENGVIALYEDVAFKKCKISSFHFYGDNASAILVIPEMQRYCYSYDLLEGRVAQIYIPELRRPSSAAPLELGALSADGVLAAFLVHDTDVFVFVLKSMEHIHTFRGQSKVVDLCFSPTDRNVIYAFTTDGIVYVWDLRHRADQAGFRDEGCVGATKISLSSNGQFIACGSSTGVINVYETSRACCPPDDRTASARQFLASEDEDREGNVGTLDALVGGGSRRFAKPIYTLNNLTTSTAFINFNHDAQLMAFGSDVKAMALRLLHVRSGRVYANFPAREEMLTREHWKCAAFSPHGAFLAFGNSGGRCRLYRLQHYARY